MKEITICSPETKCKDCNIECSRSFKHPWIATRANGKSKLSLCELINKTDLPQEQKDEIIKVINEIY